MSPWKSIHLFPSERSLKGRNPNMWHKQKKTKTTNHHESRLPAYLNLITHGYVHLTQFFLFFFLFFASASMLEPTLEWLVALVMLLTLSEECCLLMRRSGCWFCCCCCWLPLLPAEERHSFSKSVGDFIFIKYQTSSKSVLSTFNDGCVFFKSRNLKKKFNQKVKKNVGSFLHMSYHHAERFSKISYKVILQKMSRIVNLIIIFALQIALGSVAYLQCVSVCSVCTCPVPFRREFRCVDDSIDGSLSNSVLLLQQLNGLPQLIQLRVLRRDNNKPAAATRNVSCESVKKWGELFLPSVPPSKWDSLV